MPKAKKPEPLPETTSDNIDFPRPYKTRRSDALLDEEIAACLIRNEGLQYIAARELGVSAQLMSARIAQSPYLQAIKEECRQHRIDIAEKTLTKMTREDNLGSVCFTLKTIGKDRGYIETVQQTVDPQTLSSFEALMLQMKKLQES